MKRVLSIILLMAFAVGIIAVVDVGKTQAGTSTYFTILHTNDEHSALLPSPVSEYNPDLKDTSMGGFARLAHAVKAIREHKMQSNEPVLLISAGDYLGGSPFAWLALEGKAAELSLMQRLGYDVAVIGNNEYDFGPEILAQYLTAAGYPAAHNKTALLATNILPPAGHPLQGAELRHTHLQELPNGLKVGFFGVIGDDAVEKAPLSSPVEFIDPTTAAKQAVSDLRQQGANIVIAVNHAGLDEDRALAKTVPGIDVIISGHCHTALEEPIIEAGTIIVQTGNSLANLGVLELAYDNSTGKLSVRNTQNNQKYLVRLDDSIPMDPQFAAEVDALVQTLNTTVSRLSQGQFTDVADTIIKSGFVVPNKPEFTESPFGNFVTDAMRLVGSEAIGDKVDFAFQANGVLRGAITPADSIHSQGNVALLDLLDLVGLGSGPDKKPGYPLVSVYFTGEEVRRVLEVGLLLSEMMGDDYFLQVSGLRMTYDPARAVIAHIPFKGTPIPSTRAVLSAEKYVQSGVQGDSGYEALKRGDKQLYHVVSDYYIAQFLPMVGDMLPSLGLVLKDKHGNPIADIDDAIVYRNGQELKVWQTVIEYAAAQPKGNEGIALMPNLYSAHANRLTQKKTIPLIIYPTILLTAIIAAVVIILRRRRQRRSVRV